MTENKTDFEIVTDFGSLYQAYKKAKSGKGFSKSSQRFQVAALDGIHQIKRRLEAKTYEVSKYNEFTIYEPKERTIKAGSFVDKIVQHSLCDNILLPKLEDEFILTNYAGQIGRGTLYGLECLKAQMFLAYQKYGYDCWIVKADIRKFFYNINHNTLKDVVEYMGSNKELQTKSTHSFYVIIADRDGVRKYISKSFPNLFQYTISLSKAQRFDSVERADQFIEGFNDYGKYVIENPEIRMVIREFLLVDRE